MRSREYLVSLGLAKPGRGRLSLTAKEALSKAMADGMTFDDVVTINLPKAETKIQSNIVIKSRPQTSVQQAATPKNQIGVVRNEKVMYGISKAQRPGESNVVIALSACDKCSYSINRCPCVSGPVLPKFLGGTPGLLTRPNV